MQASEFYEISAILIRWRMNPCVLLQSYLDVLDNMTNYIKVELVESVELFFRSVFE